MENWATGNCTATGTERRDSPMKDIQPVTGYIRGGCSPVGMKKQFPAFIDETAQLFDSIGVSAGERGIQVILSPLDLVGFISARFADLT